MMLIRFIGFLFSWMVLGLFSVMLGVGGLFYVYGDDLPDHTVLARYEPPTTSRIYSGEGRLMDEFARERRLFTPIDEIPDLVKNAFVSAEDQRFWTHPGFDLRGIARAVRDAALGRGLTGASTITQQTMKNFLLDSSRTYERKIREIILATRVEAALSKERILELYLNEIFLGQNSYGVTAAARTYFNKGLEDLTPGEAAYLAALPKAPSDLHPVRRYERALERRDYVLGRMVEDGHLDEDIAMLERDRPLVTVQSGALVSARSEMPPRDYFTDEIRRQLSAQLGEEALYTGGLGIRATVDPELQALAGEALRRGLVRYDRSIGRWHGPAGEIEADFEDEESWRAALSDLRIARDIPAWLPAVVLMRGQNSVRVGIDGVAEDEDGHYVSYGSMYASAAREGLEVGDVIFVEATDDGWAFRQIPEVQGAFTAMDVATGRVVAMMGGFSYQYSVFNRATQATRQPGSTFKPLVYAAALDNGYTPATIVVDAPIEVSAGGEIWRPQNASNRFYGETPLRTGIEQSRNVMTVRIAQDIGMDRVAEHAEAFGVYDDMPEFLAYSLGAGETTLLRMVTAYAMFANGGRLVEPTLVDRVQDRWGRTIYRHDQRQCNACAPGTREAALARDPWIWDDRQQVMDPITAYQITSMMRGVVDRGTASRAITLDVPFAGKTGTTNDSKDVWFVGFTPNVAAGCYVGHDTPRSLGRAYGGTVCAPIVNEFMQLIAERDGPVEFAVPPDSIFVKIDRFTGVRLPDSASGPNVIRELFRIGEEPMVGFGSGITIDGGFAMGGDFELFAAGQSEFDAPSAATTATGRNVTLAPRATFGSLSSGGLY